MSDVNINGTRLPVEELHFSFLVHKLRNEFGYLQSSREKIPVDGDGAVMPLFTYPAYEYLNSIDWTDPKPAKVFEYGSCLENLDATLVEKIKQDKVAKEISLWVLTHYISTRKKPKDFQRIFLDRLLQVDLAPLSVFEMAGIFDV